MKLKCSIYHLMKFLLSKNQQNLGQPQCSYLLSVFSLKMFFNHSYLYWFIWFYLTDLTFSPRLLQYHLEMFSVLCTVGIDECYKKPTDFQALHTDGIRDVFRTLPNISMIECFCKNSYRLKAFYPSRYKWAAIPVYKWSINNLTWMGTNSSALRNKCISFYF